MQQLPVVDQQPVTGILHFGTVAEGTTAQDYLAEEVTDSSRSEKPFSFANSVTGCEVIVLLERFAIDFDNNKIVFLGKDKTRYIALATGTRIYYFRFEGSSTAMDAQRNAISQLAKSLVVSAP